MKKRERKKRQLEEAHRVNPWRATALQGLLCRVFFAGSSIARSVASIKNVIVIEMAFTVKAVNAGHSWHEKKYHQKMTRPNQLSLTSIQSARGGYAQRLGGATEGPAGACRWQPIRSFGRLRMQ